MKKSVFLITAILCLLCFSTNAFLLSILYEISKIRAYCLDRMAIPGNLFSCLEHPLLTLAFLVPIVILVLSAFVFFAGDSKKPSNPS